MVAKPVSILVSSAMRNSSKRNSFIPIIEPRRKVKPAPERKFGRTTSLTPFQRERIIKFRDALFRRAIAVFLFLQTSTRICSPISLPAQP
jgi:hypothetical protein